MTRRLPDLNLPPGTALELAKAADARMVAQGMDKGVAWPDPEEPGVWRLGGLWRLHCPPGRFALEEWNWKEWSWDPARLPQSATHLVRFPFLRWGHPFSAQRLNELFLKPLIDEAIVEAANAWADAHGSDAGLGAIAEAQSALEVRWARSMVDAVKAFERFRRAVRAAVGPEFVSAVRRIRRGQAFALTHLLTAWPHREEILALARSRPAWLPLLNGIGLAHWGSAGWREPEGWLLRKATFSPAEERWVLPWETGLRWEYLDLPAFSTEAEAQAWLDRKECQSWPWVWRSATDVHLYEAGLKSWEAQPWWPARAPPPSMLALLQQVHADLTGRLVDPPPAPAVAALVRGWLERDAALGRAVPASTRRARLVREWYDLIEAIDAWKDAGGAMDWDALEALPVRHPWVARARSRHLEGALEAAPVVPAENGRARL